MIQFLHSKLQGIWFLNATGCFPWNLNRWQKSDRKTLVTTKGLAWILMLKNVSKKRKQHCTEAKNTYHCQAIHADKIFIIFHLKPLKAIWLNRNRLTRYKNLSPPKDKPTERSALEGNIRPNILCPWKMFDHHQQKALSFCFFRLYFVQCYLYANMCRRPHKHVGRSWWLFTSPFTRYIAVP